MGYFSTPQTLPELREELCASPKTSTKTLLQNLDLAEVPPPKHLFPITADSEATSLPQRHESVVGTMHDRDGFVRTWNGRWHLDVGPILNERLHPLHRQYFVQRSVFEDSPTQHWRRFQDQE